MQSQPSFTQIFHLIQELRRAAIENQDMAATRDEGSLHLCLGAALANDAADVLEALAAERSANDHRHRNVAEAGAKRRDRDAAPGLRRV